MIYLFAGDDTRKKHLNFEKFLGALPKTTEIFSIKRNNFDPMRVESFYSGSTLFSTISAVVFEDILEREDMQDFILPLLPLMSESGNYFIFLEGRLPKAVVDKFKKSRSEVNVFELSKDRLLDRQGKERKFDNFLIANAFASKDRLKLWLYWRKAMEDSASLDAIAGILFWKVKDMILRKNFINFSEEELQNLALRIAILLPESRKKGMEAELAFEQFLLEAF